MTRNVFIITAGATIVFLVSILLIMGIRISNLSEELKANRQTYNRELEDSKLSIDEISQNLELLSSASNEVRRSLSLPEKRLIQSHSTEDVNSQFNLSVTFFDAFRYLVDNETMERTAGEFSSFIDDLELDDYFSSHDYLLKRIDFFNAGVFRNGIEYLLLKYSGESGTVRFVNILGDQFELKLDDKSTLIKLDEELEQYDLYDEKVEDLKDTLVQLSDSEEIQQILTERGLVISHTKEDIYKILNNKNDSIVGSFNQEREHILLNSEQYSSIETFQKSLIDFVSTVNNKTDSEIVDALVLDKMVEVFSDEGFKVLLETNNCKSELSKREDEEFVYFDVLNSDGMVKGSFVLQKDFGEVLLLTGDGKYLKSLKMFTPGNDLRSLILSSENKESYLPHVFDDSSENFLVVGTHEHNADTMIIVNANNKTGQLNMISIPRDLYYKGRKINNIYNTFGPERLAFELSDITGLDIKKYISIDMFAFVDVVNILEGLDVTLEKDLIDPTYKVKNNGVWSTLYYRKGTHHLDGVAALRVARSRHGSDDFDRSRRQQLVIRAVFDQLKKMNSRDISKIYDFVSTVFSYIDTNLNTADIVKNFLMYKDNEITDPNVINTDNILYATYTNLYLLPVEEQKKLKQDENFYKGLWIVLPRDNNWSLIKKHIETILKNGI